MLIALRQWDELALHTRGAIINGMTETQIREVVSTVKNLLWSAGRA